MTASLPGQKVDIPLPPETAELFGYRGDARFVAFGWSYDHLTGSHRRQLLDRSVAPARCRVVWSLNRQFPHFGRHTPSRATASHPPHAVSV